MRSGDGCFTCKTGSFTNGEKAIAGGQDGVAWTVYANGRRVRITNGMFAGKDALYECLNMVQSGDWTEIDAIERPRDLPAAAAELVTTGDRLVTGGRGSRTTISS